MAVGSYLAPHDSTALVEAVSPGKATPIQMSLPLPTDAAKPSGNDLGAVICVASADCLASGSYDTGKTISLGQGTTENISAGVAENLFGATWGAWPLGSGASGRDRQITIEGLACPAPAQCLTAGYYYADDVSGAVTESRPALLTIAGSSSGPVQVPLPADARQSGGLDTLNSLACTSPGWCVAAGSYTDTHGRLQGLIETLERGSWTAATAALPADAAADQKTHLNGVACTAPGSCIAVGTYAGPGGITQGLIETIKDGSLRAARGPNLAGKHGGELDAIACPGPGNCVAVGDYTTAGGSVPLIENLADGTWAESSPQLPVNATKTDQAVYLNAVACARTSYCVAVGSYIDSRKLTQGLIESTATAAPKTPASTSRGPAAAWNSWLATSGYASFQSFCHAVGQLNDSFAWSYPGDVGGNAQQVSEAANSALRATQPPADTIDYQKALEDALKAGDAAYQEGKTAADMATFNNVRSQFDAMNAAIGGFNQVLAAQGITPEQTGCLAS